MWAAMKPRRRPALEHRLELGAGRADLPEVVHDPDRVEADLVGGPHGAGEGRADRLGSAGPGERVDLESELHDVVPFVAAPGGGRPIEGLDLGWGEREGEGAGVVGRLAAVLGARDGQDELVLDQPAQGDLGWAPAVGLADLAEQGDDRGRRPRAPCPRKRGMKRRKPDGRAPATNLPVRAPLASGWLAMSVTPSSRQASRTPSVSGWRWRSEYSTWFEASGTPRSARTRVGQSHLVGRVVADADRPDLALLDGVGHQVHELRDRDPARRVVVHVQVDGRALEELEASLERPGHRRRPATACSAGTSSR